jgi:hypothetical protein
VAVLSTRSRPRGKCWHQRRKKNYGHRSERVFRIQRNSFPVLIRGNPRIRGR